MTGRKLLGASLDSVVRLMSSEAFRLAQFDGRYADHVAPVNHLVDKLSRGNRWAPYVAPHQGGVTARILSLSSNPGPATHRDSGSAFISCENDDGSAARMCDLYEAAGVSQGNTIPWNAYPWFLHDQLGGGGLKRSHVAEGIKPLKRLLDLLPDVAIVILHGNDAKNAWSKLTTLHGQYVRGRGLAAIPTWHTSNRALATNRDERMADLRNAYGEAAELIANGSDHERS